MSDLLPTCPTCAEVNDHGCRVCTGCGSWLEYDDALREKHDRMKDLRAIQIAMAAA